MSDFLEPANEGGRILRRSKIGHPFDPKQRLHDIVVNRKLTLPELDKRRTAVEELLLQSSKHVFARNFQSISSEDLGTLFQAIDELYFDGCITAVNERYADRPLQFRLSTRMTSTGGTTTMRLRRGPRTNRHFEIAVATTPLFETFRVEESTHVGGLLCHNRLEALQRIMEHEVVHLVELLLWEQSNCSAFRYKEMVGRLFGHSESNHRMLTPRDVARKRIGLKIGDRVIFEIDGHRLRGTINRISKRATVLVPSSAAGSIRFNDGNFYLKYYVPLHRLRPAG